MHGEMRTLGAAVLFIAAFLFSGAPRVQAAYHFSNYRGVPPIHILRGASKTPVGMTPDAIKTIYNLPKTDKRKLLWVRVSPPPP